MKYSKWEQLQVNPLKVELDKENYRLLAGENEEYETEDDIVSYMIKTQDVVELAESMANHGFNPVEPLLIIQNNKEQIVVEGNRRLTALKLLLDDNLREEFASEVKLPKLAPAARAVLKNIPAVKAQSKDDALQFIVDRHMGISLKPWTVEQSRMLVSDLYEKGFSENKIAETIQRSGGDTRKALREVGTIKYFKQICFGLGYKPSDLTTKTFPLLYFFQRQSESLQKSPKNLLGIAYDGEFQISLEDESKERKKQLEKIAVGFLVKQKNNSPKYDTRTPRDQILEEIGFFEEWKKKIKSEHEPVKKDSSEDPKNSREEEELSFPEIDKPLNKKAGKKNENEKNKTKDKSKARAKTYTAARKITEIKCRIKSPPASKYLNELQTINVNKNPIATALLARALIEACLIYYFEKRKANLQDSDLKLSKLLDRFISRITQDNKFKEKTQNELKNYMITYKNNHKDIIDKSIHGNTFINLTPDRVRFVTDELVTFFDNFLDEDFYA